MNIIDGIYRGISVTVTLVPETSGQMAVSLMTKSPDFIRLVKGKIGEDLVRATFKLPMSDKDEFGSSRFGISSFDIGEGENGLGGVQWWFDFPCLKGHPTRFEYLHFLFDCIDELLLHIPFHKEEPNGDVIPKEQVK